MQQLCLISPLWGTSVPPTSCIKSCVPPSLSFSQCFCKSRKLNRFNLCDSRGFSNIISGELSGCDGRLSAALTHLLIQMRHLCARWKVSALMWWSCTLGKHSSRMRQGFLFFFLFSFSLTSCLQQCCPCWTSPQQASASPRAGCATATSTARTSQTKSPASRLPASPPSTPVPTTPRFASPPTRSATARWTAATARMKDPSAVREGGPGRSRRPREQNWGL